MIVLKKGLFWISNHMEKGIYNKRMDKFKKDSLKMECFKGKRYNNKKLKRRMKKQQMMYKKITDLSLFKNNMSLVLA
jgi:hypothetical protein